MLDRLASAIKSAVTRGKVQAAAVGPRTFIQVSGLDGVLQQSVELLLPPGYSARPAAGADVVLLQILGSADHVVALGGDMAGGAIADLAPGEIGLAANGQMVVLRTDHIQLVSPTKVRVEAPLLQCVGDLQALCDGAYVSLAQHTHPDGGTSGTSGPPNGNT